MVAVALVVVVVEVLNGVVTVSAGAELDSNTESSYAALDLDCIRRFGDLIPPPSGSISSESPMLTTTTIDRSINQAIAREIARTPRSNSPRDERLGLDISLSTNQPTYLPTYLSIERPR